MIKGAPRFDGLTVSKIEVDFFKNPIHIEAMAAFINTVTGDTHGWTRSNNAWSEETRELLQKLRESMERDLSKRHLTDGAIASPQPGLKMGDKSVGGLGEHIGSETDAPSV